MLRKLVTINLTGKGRWTLDTLKTEINSGNVDTLLIGTIETYGKLITKTIDADYFLQKPD